MAPFVPVPLALVHAPDYLSPDLDRLAAQVLDAACPRPSPGSRVLVKPNLVTRRNAHLSCTHPRVVRAACAWLLDHGARPFVADSPAFGDAAGVARACGLDAALAPLGLTVRPLSRPRPLALSFGGAIGVSAEALEADAILNVPRLKAHRQMVMTVAVKNLFGLAVGFRKAVAHARFGEQGNRFEAAILDILAACPPVCTLLDAVTAMHRDGPAGGDPLDLGMLAACADPVALDTGLYQMIGLKPADVPLWREALDRGLPGARAENLAYSLARPEEFQTRRFQVPASLLPVTFRPLRLLKGRLRSLWDRLG